MHRERVPWGELIGLVRPGFAEPRGSDPLLTD